MRTGKSGSLRDQPSELTESRNELFAMVQPELVIESKSQLNGEKAACTAASADKARGSGKQRPRKRLQGLCTMECRRSAPDDVPVPRGLARSGDEIKPTGEQMTRSLNADSSFPRNLCSRARTLRGRGGVLSPTFSVHN